MQSFLSHYVQSFERLMTFYTPDLSSGPPGSFPSVQVVPADHVPGELFHCSLLIACALLNIMTATVYILVITCDSYMLQVLSCIYPCTCASNLAFLICIPCI